MKAYEHSAGRKGPFFEGWYFKQQARDGSSLALIPALHTDGRGRSSASLQVISDQGTWWLEYPGGALRAERGALQIELGGGLYGRGGIRVEEERDGLSLRGAVRFGPFRPLRSDIMGPFRFLPGMECRHGVVSMGHALTGELSLNGRPIDFTGGTGYIETDRGRSFPSAYLWTQCLWGESRGSVMLSIATIPLAAGSFTGCICALFHQGREYRLATYRGGRVERWSGRGALVRQGKYRLAVELLKGEGLPLRAPVKGSMGRTIRESLSAAVRYRLWEGETLVMDRTEDRASFEYADGTG